MTIRYLEHDWFPRPLPDNVQVGPRSWLYSSYAFARCRSHSPREIQIGHDTGIYIGSVFDLGPHGEVRIGNYCTLVAVAICCNSRVEIHDYAFLAHEVTLADHFAARPFDDPGREHAGQPPAADSHPTIVVGKNAWICGGAVLLRGARIGEGSIVGAAAVVDFEVPPFTIVAGNPARIVKRINNPGDSVSRAGNDQ